MNGDDLTANALKQQHAAAIAKGDTFKTQGVSETAARAYLDTDEGALYWYRLAEADPSATSSAIDDRALEHLTSGLELPRMETIGTHEPLVKIVPAGTPPSAYSPFWTKEAELDGAVKAGKNLSDHFGLPVVSEAPRYDVYRITPKVPTQVFVNTVAPTSELGGLVTKAGGAEQSLVPNRQLFNDPVHVRSVDNTLNLAADVERGGLSPNLVRGATALGAAAVAFDATQTASRTSDLLHAGNTTGAQSQVEHFGARNLGALGGAVLGAEIFGAAGAETGPVDLLIGGAGAVVGAVAGDKLADAYDNHKIYNQTDPQGTSWHYDPKQPQQGWTHTVVDTFAERGLSRTHVETAPLAVAERLTFQANNTAVDLALAHSATPRDPYTQPAGPNDTRSVTDAPWTRDAQTQQWSRTVTDQVMEHGLKSTHHEVANPQRTAELNAGAQQTIADNRANSPRGIAEHYQAVYAQRGWQHQGPMPEAVASALKAPANTLEASNGHTYTRGADGQWATPGLLYGTNAAEGNVRHELDATQRAAQAPAPSIPAPQHTAAPALASTAPSKSEAEPAPAAAVRQPSQAYLNLSARLGRLSQAMETDDWSAVHKDIEAYNNTPRGRAVAEQAKAIVEREQQQAIPLRPRDPREPGHPDHALNENIRDKLVSLHANAGIYPSSALIDPLTAAVALNARENRMTQVDQLQFNPDKSAIIATQGARGHNDMLTPYSITAVQPALQTPPEQSYQQMATVTTQQQQAQLEQQRQQQIAQSQPQGPSMGR